MYCYYRDVGKCFFLNLSGSPDLVNPFQFNVTFHTETSHLICIAGFYMERNSVLKEVGY